MTSRFASNAATVVCGAFLTAAALGFAPAVVGWLGLAVGCVVAATVLIAFAMRGRGILQRCVDVAIVVLAAWTIVSSRAFSGATLHWLSFASGVALFTLAMIGLVVHEALVELSLRQTIAFQDGGRAVRVPERPAEYEQPIHCAQ